MWVAVATRAQTQDRGPPRGGAARAAVMLLWRTDLPRVFCSLLSLLAAGCDMVGDEAKRGRGRSTSMRSRDDNSR